jgi:hypothetical protein
MVSPAFTVWTALPLSNSKIFDAKFALAVTANSKANARPVIILIFSPGQDP